MNIRNCLHALLAACALAAASPAPRAAEAGTPITVYKSPTCGCCAAWADYLGERGFAVRVVDAADLQAIKRAHGVPPRLHSCHTAVVDGYVIEGHVPADDIRRLLAARPALSGLSAPGMPQMSPGMMSTEPRGYDVIGFGADGSMKVFSRY